MAIEIAGMQSAPVAGEVPWLSFWKHADGKWYCWDGYANTEMTHSRILKDGERAVPAGYLAMLESAANRFCSSCIHRDSCNAVKVHGHELFCSAWAIDGARINALRSSKEGA